MDATPNEDRSGLPDNVGPYRILGLLGEGGMGVVCHARQSEPVQRDVALKLLKLGMDSEQVLERFRTEQQALAVMDHPSIAHIYDAGVSQTGRPYFVMEKVDGVPINTYCDEHRLSVRERVALFIKVCGAVQHAHQKGVIHRDLKPSNVLVTLADGRPLPKIIDFGIALATTEEAEDGTRLTRLDQMMGTPAYMSPEQIDGSGLDIDTRTDIYALGVMLYELLAGAVPFEASAKGGWAAYAAVLNTEPPRPSTRTTQGDDTEGRARVRGTGPQALRRELSGELDWIVLRAMARDREDRYETANGLALELERYLAYEPVLARAPTRRYRIAKFVRRHRAGTSFAAVIVLLLVTSMVAQMVQIRRVAAAREAADARRAEADGLIDFMLGDLREKLEPVGRLEILDDVGQRALQYFASIPDEEYTEGQLITRSRALYQIGSVRLSQGDLAAADSAFVESLRLARVLSARDPENTAWLFELGQAEFWAGALARRRGDVESAIAHMRNYRDVSVDLVSRDSANPTWLLERGYSHTNLGVLELESGNPEAAEAEFRASLAVKRRVAAEDPENTGRIYDVSQGHFNLAAALAEVGRPMEAIDEFREDLRLKDLLRRMEPENARWRARSVVTRGRLSSLLALVGDTAGAIDERRVSLEMAIEQVQLDPDNATWRVEMAVAQRMLGGLLAAGGRAEGVELLRQAVGEFEGLVELDPTEGTWPTRLAAAQASLGAARLAVSGDPAGLALLSAATDTLASILARDPDDRTTLLEWAGARAAEARALTATGDRAGADEAWAEIAAEIGAVTGETRNWQYLKPRAESLAWLGRDAEAAPLIRELQAQGVAVDLPSGEP